MGFNEKAPVHLANRCLQPLGHHSSTFEANNLTPLTPSRESPHWQIFVSQCCERAYILSHSQHTV
jgi:hypothetical protein